MATWADAGLTENPFSVVPPNGPTPVWIGRPEFAKQLAHIVGGWSLADRSEICLMWADFGAGKTHALHYLEYLASQPTPPAVCIYADLARAPDSFFDIYTRVIPRIPEGALVEAIYQYRLKFSDWLNRPELQGDRETAQVLWSLAESGSGVQGELARTWLRGGPMVRAQLSTIGAARPIRKSEDALRALTSVIGILTNCGLYSRVVLMLDEFQRVGEVANRKIHDINASLKGLFDTSPHRFTLMLTYSMGIPDRIKFMTSDDLRDRVGRQLTMKQLDRQQGLDFLSGLLRRYAVAGHELPLQEKTIEWLVDQAAESKLTPRRIMQWAGPVLVNALIEQRPLPLSVADAEALAEVPQDELLE